MTTISVCEVCNEPFTVEETQEFVLTIGLPYQVLQKVSESAQSFCVHCMRNYLSDTYKIMFTTVYEIELKERIIMWDGEKDE